MTPFDALFDSAVRRAKHLAEARDAIGDNYATLRSEAWELAAEWLQLIKEHHNEFIAHIHSGKQTVSGVMEEWFRPVRMFGYEPALLLTAIDKGFQRDQYDKGISPATYLIGRRRSSTAQRSPDNLVASLRKLVRELRSRIRLLERDMARLQGENLRLHKNLGLKLRKIG